MTKKGCHHEWLFLSENVLRSLPAFKLHALITLLYEDICRTSIYMRLHVRYVLKIIIFGGKIIYTAILGLITIISPLYFSRMTEFLQ